MSEIDPEEGGGKQNFLRDVGPYLVEAIEVDGATRVGDIEKVAKIAESCGFSLPFGGPRFLPGKDVSYGSWFLLIQAPDGEYFTFVQY